MSTLEISPGASKLAFYNYPIMSLPRFDVISAGVNQNGGDVPVLCTSLYSVLVTLTQQVTCHQNPCINVITLGASTNVIAAKQTIWYMTSQFISYPHIKEP